MATARRVKDILAAKASENFIGRQEELASLLLSLTDSGPLVTWVHGIAGIGKSALLAEFRARALALGAAIVTLDARLIEPTPAGFHHALGDALQPLSAACKTRRILIIDSYEAFLLLDAWLRQTFIPSLDDSVHIVLACRYPPSASWLLSLEWQGLFRVLTLREMSDLQALQLLTRAGVNRNVAERLNRIARGHPLALRLAALSAHSASRDTFTESAARDILRQLAGFYLDGLDPVSRAAVEAASVVHRVTPSLLCAMLPAASPDAHRHLADTCFIQATPDGLILQDAIREAVASYLISSDPHRFQRYRKAAWRQLRNEARSASRDQMWGYTSGMLYLLQNPVLREAFFPHSAQPVNVEPARPSDGIALLEIARTQETPAAAKILTNWWHHAPWAFRAVRNAAGATSGFYVYLELRDTRLPPMHEDPLMQVWRKHLRKHPIASGETAVFLRRWLSSTHGELPSPVQAACWLDVKRSYMELRPHLRRCYLSICGLEAYGPTAKVLGFEVVDDASVTLDGKAHHLAVLDFGPGSVDSWLTRLVAAELGVEPNGVLDLESRELTLEGRRIALTTLEFELLRYLQERPGKSVHRHELLQQVWQRRPDSSSNVVDVLVRSLRRKMGTHASQLVSVRGHGYRLEIS